ncbi:uncharacterized protein LOC121735605 [Aricia agestis]|uniref:uncharacterized protein LOC121735605 n=1 Tax=Aricia agestis TaxID=91739 RepID=UPI001C208CD9|nr:uncharacterized protein LOC121735605 [Aricia agestis]
MRVLLIFLSCVYAINADDASGAAAFSAAYSAITDGIPGLGISPLDPLYPENFDADFVTLKFVDTQNSVTGLSNCTASNFTLSPDNRVINFQLNCSKYTLKTLTYSKGYFLYRPVDSLNVLELNYGRTIVRVYALLNSRRDVRNNVYYQIGRFVLDVNFQERLRYNFKNQNNKASSGSTQQSDFANSNIGSELYAKEPFWYAVMSKIINNMNRYLLTTPINY